MWSKNILWNKPTIEASIKVTSKRFKNLNIKKHHLHLCSMRKEDFNIDFTEKPRITGDEGKINKQCIACNGFRDLSEFKHKKKAGRMNKTCRRCFNRSCKDHINNFILIENRNIAEDNN